VKPIFDASKSFKESLEIPANPVISLTKIIRIKTRVAEPQGDDAALK
jgi:hypothetical protein